MPAVALTFDDGPDATWTPRLLDALAGAEARAAFFPIAGRAAAHPALIARMRAEGHTIGLHCHEHVRHSARDLGWLRADTRHALESLAETGVRPDLWRAPWGDTAPWTAALAREHGLRIVGWDLDTHDWRGDSAARMYAAIAPGLESGGIVLAHDGIGPGARRTGAAETVALVERLLCDGPARGLVFTALGPEPVRVAV